MMTKDDVSALIAAQPGSLRVSLRALLMVMPQIETVRQTDDALATLRIAMEYRPALVLLDAEAFNGEFPEMIRTIKAGVKQSRCLILANDVQQQQKARAAGADVALVKGFPAAKLFKAIEDLLP
jgi:DNA-binding NarL/FixJ family response regulator